MERSFRTANATMVHLMWMILLFAAVTQVGGKGNSKNITESIETDKETNKHNDDEVGSSSNLKEILRENIRNSLGTSILERLLASSALHISPISIHMHVHLSLILVTYHE